MADNAHYVRNSGTWVSDALKTGLHGGWSITECVRNGFCTISANRTYQGSTGSFNAYVQDYKPATPYFECYGTLTGRVGLQIVSYGYCMVNSQGLLVSFNGYGNSVSLSADIVYPIKYDG